MNRQQTRCLRLLDGDDRIHDNDVLVSSLYELAVPLLSVPTFSAPVERVCSQGGHLMREICAHLKSSLLSQLFFFSQNVTIHKNTGHLRWKNRWWKYSSTFLRVNVYCTKHFNEYNGHIFCTLDVCVCVCTFSFVCNAWSTGDSVLGDGDLTTTLASRLPCLSHLSTIWHWCLVSLHQKSLNIRLQYLDNLLWEIKVVENKAICTVCISIYCPEKAIWYTKY